MGGLQEGGMEGWQLGLLMEMLCCGSVVVVVLYIILTTDNSCSLYFFYRNKSRPEWPLISIANTHRPSCCLEQ